MYRQLIITSLVWVDGKEGHPHHEKNQPCRSLKRQIGQTPVVSDISRMRMIDYKGDYYLLYIIYSNLIITSLLYTNLQQINVPRLISSLLISRPCFVMKFELLLSFGQRYKIFTLRVRLGSILCYDCIDLILNIHCLFSNFVFSGKYTS